VNLFRRLWRGELSLQRTFWLYFVAGWLVWALLAVGLLFTARNWLIDGILELGIAGCHMGLPALLSARETIDWVDILLVPLTFIFPFLMLVPIWRAARNTLWGWGARLCGVMAVIGCIGAISSIIFLSNLGIEDYVYDQIPFFMEVGHYKYTQSGKMTADSGVYSGLESLSARKGMIDNVPGSGLINCSDPAWECRQHEYVSDAVLAYEKAMRFGGTTPRHAVRVVIDPDGKPSGIKGLGMLFYFDGSVLPESQAKPDTITSLRKYQPDRCKSQGYFIWDRARQSQASGTR
jgi:hypothetical protein